MENSDTTVPIGKAVRATKDVPVYLYLGGWGDGWGTLHAGALIYLAEVEEDSIRFWAGPEPPGPPGAIRAGGLVEVCHLTDFEDYKA